jgi:hypothetical protein
MMLLEIPNDLRLIDDGTRVAVHRVTLDDSGAVIAWEPEPVTLSLEGPSGLATVHLGGLAMAVSTLCLFTAPLKLIDGKLFDMGNVGGENAQPVRAAKVALPA